MERGDGLGDGSGAQSSSWGLDRSSGAKAYNKQRSSKNTLKNSEPYTARDVVGCVPASAGTCSKSLAATIPPRPMSEVMK